MKAHANPVESFTKLVCCSQNWCPVSLYGAFLSANLHQRYTLIRTEQDCSRNDRIPRTGRRTTVKNPETATPMLIPGMTRMLSRVALRRLAAVSVLSLMMGSALLVGCGSGGSTPRGGNLGGIEEDNSVAAAFGALTTRVVGTAQAPVVTSTIGATISGVAGASFNSIHQSKATSHFVYVEGGQIWTISNTGNGTPTQITNDATQKSYPVWSPDATRIAYLANKKIYIIPATGGTPAEVPIGDMTTECVAWSPDGEKLVFVNGFVGRIYTVRVNGGASPTRINNNDSLYWRHVSWSPDGKTLVGVLSDETFGAQIATLAADGSDTPKTIFRLNAENEIQFGQHELVFPVFSRDGSRVVFIKKPIATFDSSVQVVPATGGDGQEVYKTSGALARVGWSPDGTRLSFYAPTNLPDPAFQLVTLLVTNGIPNPVANGSVNGVDADWSRYQIDTNAVPLLGSNGPLGTGTAAGFLYSQSGPDLRSVLTFGTVTDTVESRAAARVATTLPDYPDSPFRLFTITAPDGLAQIAYTNFDSATGAPGPVVAPPMLSSPPGAIVLFNTTTSQIAAVLPYTPDDNGSGAGRSIRDYAPQVVRQGNTLVLKGHFPAVFDATGKNRAPGGATEVRLNARTGEILSIP